MTTIPAFRQIGTPLDVADADLDHLNRRLGVPTLVTTMAPVKSDPIPVASSPSAPLKAINIHLPAYVFSALKDKARLADASVRYVIMSALAASGMTIEAVDLTKDARRTGQ